MAHPAVNSTSHQWSAKVIRGTHPLVSIFACGALVTVSVPSLPAYAQGALSLTVAAKLAVEDAPNVDPRTLLAFAWYESKLHPWAIHDNTAMRSEFPGSRVEAIARAAALSTLHHNLDLGLCQINSANLARAGLTVETAFDPGSSMRAGAEILTAAYERCLHGIDRSSPTEQQAALRCAASVYNTGDEQAGILSGYQAGVWRAAAQIVPAIELDGRTSLELQPAGPDTVAVPEPRSPPPGLEDVLHATAPIPDADGDLSDALHLTSRKDPP
jgi:hypothetical protein